MEGGFLMKHFNEASDVETVSIKVDFSPVWEVIVGVAGYTHAQLRHTFDFDIKWQEQSMPVQLKKKLQTIQDTNSWLALIFLQNEFSAPDIQQFSNKLKNISRKEFMSLVLPYKNRQSEQLRKEIIENYTDGMLLDSYASLFEDHLYLTSYIRNISNMEMEEAVELLTSVVLLWYEWMQTFNEWEKWMEVLAFEQKSHSQINEVKLTEEVERITGYEQYVQEPSIWTIKLIPHVSYKPWLLVQRTPDTHLLFYPIKDDYLIKQGTPSPSLVQGHKALGDELRLKLLYELMKGPSSLQQLSTQFSMSKTTLHHQLSLLRAAKFVRVHKGVYDANCIQIERFSMQLRAFLGKQSD